MVKIPEEVRMFARDKSHGSEFSVTSIPERYVAWMRWIAFAFLAIYAIEGVVICLWVL